MQDENYFINPRHNNHKWIFKSLFILVLRFPKSRDCKKKRKPNPVAFLAEICETLFLQKRRFKQKGWGLPFELGLSFKLITRVQFWDCGVARAGEEEKQGEEEGSSVSWLIPPAAAAFLLLAMLRLLPSTSNGLRQKATYCRSHVQPFAFVGLYRRAVCFKSRWKIIGLVISWVWSPRSATRLRRAGSLSPDVGSSRRIKAIKSTSLGGVTHRREVVRFLSAWLTALEQMKRRWRELFPGMVRQIALSPFICVAALRPVWWRWFTIDCRACEASEGGTGNCRWPRVVLSATEVYQNTGFRNRFTKGTKDLEMRFCFAHISKKIAPRCWEQGGAGRAVFVQLCYRICEEG